MDILSPCMTWLPILWCQLREPFILNHKSSSLLRADPPFLNDVSRCHNLPSNDDPYDHHHPDNNSLDGGGLLLLPDDIISNIFSRLTTEGAFQCLSVCRSLRTILSSPSFVATQLDRASPILVVQCYQRSSVSKHGYIVLQFVDEYKDIVVSRRYICTENKYKPFLIGSYNGLLLFRNVSIYRSALFIWNPITQEKLTVIAPGERYTECGFFFHTPTGEYRILYTCWESLNHLKFVMVSLHNQLLRKIADCYMVPCTRRRPIIINGMMHWMVAEDLSEGYQTAPVCSKSILLFKIDTEDFFTLPHPGAQCCSKKLHKQMQLLELDGHLCLCDIPSPTKLYLWVLEDYKSQVWVKKHTVNIESLVSENFFCSVDVLVGLQAIYIDNDDLLLKLNLWDLFYYNLKLNTFRKVERDSIEGKVLSSVVVHTNSFASLPTDKLITLKDRYSKGQAVVKNKEAVFQSWKTLVLPRKMKVRCLVDFRILKKRKRHFLKRLKESSFL